MGQTLEPVQLKDCWPKSDSRAPSVADFLLLVGRIVVSSIPTVRQSMGMRVRLQSYFLNRITMQTTLLSSKGQVIIPKMLRMARRWSAGTRLEVQDTPEGLLLRPITPANKTELKRGLEVIRQRVAYAGPTLSLADMDAAILQEASKVRRKPSK